MIPARHDGPDEAASEVALDFGEAFLPAILLFRPARAARQAKPPRIAPKSESRTQRVELHGRGPLRLRARHEARAAVHTHDRDQDERRQEGEREKGEED